MEANFAPLIAAAVPEIGLYVNPYKIGAVVVLGLLWAAVAQWVDKDCDVVKTKRERWNVYVMTSGFVAFVVLFLMPFQGPLFFAALTLWLLIAGGVQIAYLVHRNSRVIPTARILTPDHFRRLLAGDEEAKRKAKDKGQRIRMRDHQGKDVETPEDADEFEDYETTQDFLFDLLWRRVSEVDVLAGREKYRVVTRVDGVAGENPDGLPPEEGERIFRCLKKIAGLNPEEIRRPQAGKIKIATLAQTG